MKCWVSFLNPTYRIVSHSSGLCFSVGAYATSTVFWVVSQEFIDIKSLANKHSKQDILDREKNHRVNAIKKPEIYGYKKDMKLQVIIDGLNDDEMHYHDRRVFEQLTAQGIKLKYEQEPMGYARINELIEKYC
jgi:hypothetical protein